MRPTFMGFESATRGLMAQQKALDIVGNNVGNIGVTGYTRQRVDMVSLANNSASARYAQNPTGKAGQGVMVTGVSQIRDPFLDKRFREEFADVGYYQTMGNILGDIEDGLNEIAPSNVSEALNAFQNSWKNMMGEGSKDPVIHNTILASAKSMTQVFKQLDSKLESIWNQQKFDLEVNVNNVNSIIDRIANLNDAIARETQAMKSSGSSSSMPNELLDARNVLIDQLSKFGDIQTKAEVDGTVTITMGSDNHVVVKGDWSDEMVLSAPTGGRTVALRWQTTGANVASTSGSMRASVDMLNGRGPAAQPALGENFDKGILYYQDKINAFAKTFAEAFNSFIPVYDANGVEIGNKQLFTFSGNGDAVAKNITINSIWESKPSFIIDNIYKPGEGTDSTSIADRANALFTKDQNFGEFKGTFNSYISFYTTANLGNQANHASSRLESCADIADKILNDISAISGVSIEEEGVDMVQYTKAYNAMGRVMTALDEALDTLINKVGLVGR